jgi:hypothetical protein
MIVGGPGYPQREPGLFAFFAERTPSVKRPPPRGGKSMRPRARTDRVRPGVSYDKDAPASSLPNSAAITSLLQSHEPISQKDRTVPLECAECGARYIAVLVDDPPDWKPHCIECGTPFGPVRGRAVYCLYAAFD